MIESLGCLMVILKFGISKNWNRLISVALIFSVCFSPASPGAAEENKRGSFSEKTPAAVTKINDQGDVETKDSADSDGNDAFLPDELIIKLKDGKTPNDIEDLNKQYGVISNTKLFGENASPEDHLKDLRKKLQEKETTHESWYWQIDKNSEEYKEYVARLEKEKEELKERIQHFEQRLKRASGYQEAARALENIYKLNFAQSADIPSIVKIYSANPAVAYAEPNYKVSTNQIPNDPRYPEQWGPDKIQAPLAWDVTTGSSQVIVAVIDTGVDYNHPDLSANIWSDPITGQHGYDFFNKDNDPMDDNGHGTHCSGIANAVTNNSVGIAGISWNSRIMAVKFLSASGSGSIDDGASAIRWAADHGADVLSNSWGGGGYSETVNLAIEYAHSLGCVVVAAAGNDNTNQIFYPAGYEHVISVSATDQNDVKAYFSNYGYWVDVAAPGVSILSTVPSSSVSLGDPSGYKLLNGTSMACPHVSGLAALIVGSHPEFSDADVLSVLKATADDILSANTSYIGQGRINCRKALQVTKPPPTGALVTEGVLSGKRVIRGIAGGSDFTGYSLYYAPGRDAVSSSWTLIAHATGAVQDDFSTPQKNDGILYADFDTTRLSDGNYTLRLVVEGQNNLNVEYRTNIQSKNITVAFPLNNDILKKGETFTIRGGILGSFLDYSIEYGEGNSPTVWKTAGITLLHQGLGENYDGNLASWDTSVLTPVAYGPGNFYTLRITVRRSFGVMTSFVRMVYLDDKLKRGWPQYIPEITDYMPIVTADLDHDGRKEIIIVQPPGLPGNPTLLFVYNTDGSLRWSRRFNKDYSDGQFAIPVVGDMDGDGLQEIFLATRSDSDVFGSEIQAIRSDGSDFGHGWPVFVPSGGCSMLVSDLDRDGNVELVVRTAYPTYDIGIGAQYVTSLYIINRQGQIGVSVPMPFDHNPADPPNFSHPQFLAIGNFDDDPQMEIVTHCQGVKIAVFNMDGSMLPGWPVRVGEALWGPPVVGDVDRDGYDNIVVGTFLWDTSAGGLFVLDKDGHTLPGWPVLADGSFYTSPALGDLDGNGYLEICISLGKWTYLFDYRGNRLPGWPRETNDYSNFFNSNLLGDVNGDGKVDVVARAGGFRSAVVRTGDTSTSGGIYAWNLDGSPIDLNPYSSNVNLFTESFLVAFVGTFAEVPGILDDIDNDGKIDLIAASRVDIKWVSDEERMAGAAAEYKKRGSIYVWSLDAAYNASKTPWPMFQHDNACTGRDLADKDLSKHPDDLAPPNVFMTAPAHDAIIAGTIEVSAEASDNVGVSGVQFQLDGVNLGDEDTEAPYSTVWDTSTSDAGYHTLGAVARDSAGNSAASILIAVTVNSVPVLNPVADQAVREMDRLEFTLSGTDDDGDALTYSADNLPAGASFNPTSGLFAWTPDYTQEGAYSVYFTVNDGVDVSNTQTVNITVENVNRLPVLNAIPAQTVDEGSPISVTLSGSDLDGESLTYSSGNLPTGAVLNASTGLFEWTPDYTQSGSYSVSFTVSDGTAVSDTQTMNITVQNVNRSPVLNAIPAQTVDEGSPISITLSASDLDGESLTYSSANLPTGAVLNATTGLFEWTPDYTQSGSYSVSFTASDGTAVSDTQTVDITVGNVNRSPVLNTIPAQTVPEGNPLEFVFSGTDPDGDALTYSVGSLPVGAVWDASTHTLRWTPTYTQSGPYSITCTVSDGSLNASGTMSITVQNVNRSPVLSAIPAKTVDEGSPISVTLSASDPDGESLTYSSANLPTGAVLNASTGLFEWTPGYTQGGPGLGTPYTIQLTASDGQLSDTKSFSVNVKNKNGPPELALIGKKTINENEQLTFTVSATEPDNESITFSVKKLPSGNLPSGASFKVTTKVFSWKPTFSQSGTYHLEFKAKDPGNRADTEDVEIVVNNVNRPPVLNAISNKSVKKNRSLSFTISGSDPDGGTLTYAAKDLPSGAQFNAATRQFSWTPTTTQVGSYVVKFTLTDGTATVEKSVTITVTN